MLNSEQLAKASVYNGKQAGNLWWIVDLPESMKSARTADSAAFALAVGAFQEANGLKADGMLGPGTLAAINAAKAPKADPSDCGSLGSKTQITKVALALVSTATAEADKGVRETGKNAGVDVEKYLKCVALVKGNPWCAAFVSWCVMTSRGAAKPPKWCSGSAVSLFQMARAQKAVCVTPADADFKTKVKAGWIWSRAKDATAAAAARKGVWCQGHTGIVVKVDDVGFHTVEGNTNAAGSREGDGVYRKLHKWSDEAIIGKTVGWFDPASV
jgi:hypothetical protein